MLQIELLVDGFHAGYHRLEEDWSLEIVELPVGNNVFQQVVFMNNNPDNTGNYMHLEMRAPTEEN